MKIPKGCRTKFLESKYEEDITLKVNTFVETHEQNNEILDIVFKTCYSGSGGYFCVMIVYKPRNQNARLKKLR